MRGSYQGSAPGKNSRWVWAALGFGLLYIVEGLWLSLGFRVQASREGSHKGSQKGS